LTVAQLFSPVIIQPDLAPVMVMVGSISDGGKVKRMHAFIRDPEGQGLSVRPLVEEGLTWSLSFQPMVAGMYQVWIAAEDEAGNLTVAGPFTVVAETITVVESVPAMTIPPVIPTETPWLIGTPTPTFTETPTPLWIDTPTPAPSLTDMPLPTLTETPVPTPTWTVTPTPMAESP